MTESNSALAHTFEAIQEGQVVDHTYLISAETYGGFINTFGDRSPLHVDTDSAKALGFQDIVMHGTILNGFLSHFIGMLFPGRTAMLLSVELRYLQPCFMGDEVQMVATVKQKQHTHRVLIIQVHFIRIQDQTLVASGRVMTKVYDV